MDIEFDYSKFVNSVLRDNYTLVIGSQAILNRTKEEYNAIEGDSHQLVQKRVREYFAELGGEEINYCRKVWRLLNSNKYSLSCHEGAKWDEVKDDINPDLITLIKTRLFRTVLTTTYDYYLEHLMKHVWGDDLLVVDAINDSVNLKKISDELNDYMSKPYFIPQPVLIYAFGRSNLSGGTVVLNDEKDAFLAIKWWMGTEEGSKKTLINFIKKRHTLAIGCKFEDWYFRFFWYIINDIKNYGNTHGMGQVVFWGKENDEKKLKTYLDNNLIDLKDVNSEKDKDHLQVLLRHLTSDSYESIKKHVEKGGIFISYKSKDSVFAEKLMVKLRDLGYNVWLDTERLRNGEEFNEEIKKAIECSKVVIVLLSNDVKKDLEDTNSSFYKEEENKAYYRKEWEWAQSNKKVIIPLAIGEYRLRDNYHQKVEEVIGSRTGTDLGDDLRQVGLGKLYNDISEQL